MQGKTLLPEDEERVLVSYTFARPFLIVLTSVVEPFVGIRQAFSIINLLLYIGSTFLVFYYCKRKYTNEIIAYIAAGLYATSLPIIVYGSRILSDISGYFFLILGIYCIDKFLEKKNWGYHLLIVLYISVSLLVREYCMILIPYYVLSLFITNELSFKSILQSIKKNIKYCLLLILIPLPLILFSKIYHSLLFFSNKTAEFSFEKLSLLGFVKFIFVIFFTFHILWFLFLYALKQDKERKSYYLSGLISTVPLIIGAYLFALLSPRMVFILFPFIIPAAAYSIYEIAKRYDKYQFSIIFGTLLFYALLSYCGAWLYPSHTLIPEAAGGNVVLQAIFLEIQQKIGGLL
jgi:4-amino-4-deoxy-L-arabinose transferase-like glycosyltransferase